MLKRVSIAKTLQSKAVKRFWCADGLNFGLFHRLASLPLHSRSTGSSIQWAYCVSSYTVYIIDNIIDITKQNV